MASGRQSKDWSQRADDLFRHLEHSAYLLLGLLLAAAAALLLVNAAILLGQAALSGSGEDEIVTSVDSLLFVFMLVEILHTVRVSLRSGGLSCEPFLVVGLIASIRRVLVITLQTSQVTKASAWNPQTEAMLRSSLIELGVMGGLILAMVISIYLLHRANPAIKEPAGTSV